METSINRIIFFLGSMMFLIISCGHEADYTGFIDYEELGKIKVETILDLGESEEYIPVHLGDMILASDGNMLVSDPGNMTIIQFSSEGVYLDRISRGGQGPGELSPFFYIHDMANDTFAVRHQQTNQYDLFGRGENGRYRFSRTVPPGGPEDRHITILGSRNSSSYYANREPIHINPQQQHDVPVVVVDELLNIQQDSIYMLKNEYRHLHETGGGGIAVYGIPYSYRDRFIPMGEGKYLIARPDSASLLIYNSNHELDRTIPLKVKRRLVEREDLDYKLGNMRREVRSSIEAKVRQYKPPYLNLWVSKDHIWLHTDDSEEGKHIVVLTMEGESLGEFRLSEFDDIQYFREDRIYVLHKNPDTGHRIRMYQVDL